MNVMNILREVEAKVLENDQTGWLESLTDVDPEYAGILKKAAIEEITRNVEQGSVSWYDVSFNNLLLAAAETEHGPQRDALVELIAILVIRVMELDSREGALVPAGRTVVEGEMHAELPWIFDPIIGEECA